MINFNHSCILFIHFVFGNTTPDLFQSLNKTQKSFVDIFCISCGVLTSTVSKTTSATMLPIFVCFFIKP